MNLRHLKDDVLLVDTKNLVARERELLTEILWHLHEIDRRKLFSPEYQSLWDYLIRGLGYAEGQAARRIAAMRLLKELPEIETKIADGSLSLTNLGLAQRHFQNENSSREEKIEILKSLETKSTREAEKILITQSSDPVQLKPETVRPVSQTLNEVRLHLSDAALKKIEKLKGLVAHKHPYLTMAEAFELALDQTIASIEKMKMETPQCKKKSTLAITSENPPESQTENNAPILSAPKGDPAVSRRASAALSREVWREARGRCALCGSIHELQKDHRMPSALGGPTTKANLRLLCFNCNQRQKVMMFG